MVSRLGLAVLVALTMTACSTRGPEPSLAVVSGRPDSNELSVFTGTCNADDLEVTVVEESATEVVLRVSGGRGTTDDCGDSVAVRLSDPLGGRTVRDARTGATVVVVLDVDPLQSCDTVSERHLGNGIVVAVPQAFPAPVLAQTDDPGPIHAEAGAIFELDDGTIEIWRTSIEPSPEVLAGDVVWKQDGGMYLILRYGPPQWADCLMASLRYDPALDQLDP